MPIRGESLALEEADRHVADAERRVAEQEIRLEGLRQAGHDLGAAERLLGNLQDLLTQFRHHREEIASKPPQRP